MQSATRWLWRLFLILIATVVAAERAQAQSLPEIVAAQFTDDRSPTEVYGPGYRLVPNLGYRDSKGRVPIEIGLRLIQLSSIDSKEETFSIEAILYVVWSDDWGSESLGWTGLSVDEKLKKVPFRPVPTFENGLGIRDRYGLLMQYDPNLRRIKYQERFSMTFSNELDFRKFPFDSQTLSVDVIITGGQERFIDLRIYEFTHSAIDEPEWHTDSTSYASGVQHNIVPYNIETSEGRKVARYPRARFSVLIQRRSGYYVWRVLLPLWLITSISWALFWMKKDNLGERLSVAFTALLTVVAYNFILGELLPRIAYPTFVDAMIIMTYVGLSTAVLESVIVGILEARRPESLTAARIDRWSQVIFPFGYTLGVGITAALFLS